MAQEIYCPLKEAGFFANPSNANCDTTCDEESCGWWVGERCAITYLRFIALALEKERTP